MCLSSRWRRQRFPVILFPGSTPISFQEANPTPPLRLLSKGCGRLENSKLSEERRGAVLAPLVLASVVDQF
ncbi:hypothetical protein C4D60_Mb05t15650 [Musa balbisiana]|uniref:Uncharacterized protein n=1 Tax=Musa balbisiana TaxID=52838 RepID=A0A4S8JWE4_MUSBA|nr:hypothetical protein C4D60_Mb05t15650 [Musa balbisiana]